MKVSVFYFVTISAVIFIIQKIFFWTTILQKNNYEIKKTFNYLSIRKEIPHLFFGIENLIHISLIALYFATLIESRSTPFYTLAVSLFFLIYILITAKQVLRKQIFVPHLDFQTSMTFLIVFPFAVGLMLFPLLDDFFWYLFICKLVVFIVFVLTIIFQLPKGFYRDILILRSNRKIAQLKNLKTIVILGDKKKSELQTILFQMLNQKYSVANVLEDGTIHNISKTISKKTTKETEYLIVPVTSHEREEIAEIIHMLNPFLCIIHQDVELTFNQSERVFKEFMSVFNNKTKIILVGHDKQSDFLKNRKFTNFLVTTIPKKKIKNLYHGQSVVIHRSFASFVMNTPGKKSIRIKTSIISPTILSSVITATAVAYELKFSTTQIINSLSKILPIEGSLNFKKIQNGAIIVNASNDNMADESISFLGKVRGVIGRKIVVYSVNEDLGRANKIRYQEVGKRLSNVADVLYLISSSQNKFTENGVSYRTKKSRFLMSTVSEITESLKKKFHKNDVCIFIGTQSDEVYKKMV